MKTHKVLDITAHSAKVFTGTYAECQNFVAQNVGITFIIHDLTEDELKEENQIFN